MPLILPGNVASATAAVGYDVANSCRWDRASSPEMVKTLKIANIKKQAAGILAETDWYIVRKADADTAVPSAITNHRAAVRTKCAAMETLVTNASNTAAIQTLYIYVNTADEGDPVVMERPLGEFPEAV